MTDMPKLRDETYAARRAHILAAARICFARGGFHGASMQDIQTEAGVSAGAIYVYFPRKADIVDAVIEDSARRLSAVYVTLLEERVPLRDALVRLLAVADANATGSAAGIGFEIWAETARDERAARRQRRLTRSLRVTLIRLVEGAIESGELPRDTDARAAGAVLLGAIFGYYAQRIITGDVKATAYADAVVASLRG